MNLAKDITSGEVNDLSHLRETGPGIVLTKVVEQERDLVRRQNESAPKIDDADIRNDFRFKAGWIAALNMVLSLDQSALKLIRDRATQQEKAA